MAQALGQQLHKRLGGSVDRHAEFRGQPHHRTDIDDGTFASLHQPRCNGTGKAGQCCGVERNQGVKALHTLFKKAARLGHASIVDQDADLRVVT